LGAGARADRVEGRRRAPAGKARRKKGRTNPILISTHGYTGVKHVVIGSTAENVVRHSSCPVLTIRAGAVN